MGKLHSPRRDAAVYFFGDRQCAAVVDGEYINGRAHGNAEHEWDLFVHFASDGQRFANGESVRK